MLLPFPLGTGMSPRRGLVGVCSLVPGAAAAAWGGLTGSRFTGDRWLLQHSNNGAYAASLGAEVT